MSEQLKIQIQSNHPIFNTYQNILPKWIHPTPDLKITSPKTGIFSDHPNKKTSSTFLTMTLNKKLAKKNKIIDPIIILTISNTKETIPLGKILTSFRNKNHLNKKTKIHGDQT
jgi:hypothetical protein